MPLRKALTTIIKKYGLDKTYWVAISGGLDSHVLLSLCHALGEKYSVSWQGIHIHHGLSSNADYWAETARAQCAAYAVPYHQVDIAIDHKPSISLEENARILRYAAFAEKLGKGDILLTAHHQDDQAETILLQLLRGSGPKGLAAMPSVKPFAQGLHIRPLLSFQRTDLLQYAMQHDLSWIEDESNQDTQRTRNFLRQTIMPRLRSRFPSVSRALARSALHCAETQSLLDDYVRKTYLSVKGEQPDTLSLAKVLQLSDAQQRAVLRYWITTLGFRAPDTRKLLTIQGDILSAARDRMPCVRFAGCEVRRYRDDIYLMPSCESQSSTPAVVWDVRSPLYLPGLGCLRSKQVQGAGLHPEFNRVTVNFRSGGEVAKIPGRGRHRLKNLFQEWGIPPWERKRIPLIFLEDKLIAAVGYFIDPDYLCDAQGFTLIWEKNPPQARG